jgi:glycerophosphoryl diester phosphodiesterase
MKKTIICAHRGLEDSTPENTRAAFEGGLVQGMAVEMDIQRTADDHLVVMHDPTVDRTTDGSGEIAQMTLAQIKTLDAGSWYGPQFAGQRVITFDEALELAVSHKLVSPSVALDVKLLPPDTTTMIRDCLENHGMIEEVVCIGAGRKSVEVRRQFHEVSDRFQCAVTADDPEEIDAALNDDYSTWVYARFVPTAEDVLRVNGGGKRMIVSGPCVAYDINGVHEACRAGADMVLTWHPTTLRLVGPEAANGD